MGIVPETPKGLNIAPSVGNVRYVTTQNILISGLVLAKIILAMKFTPGFLSNISVLIGIVVGALAATAMALMTFDKVGHAGWFELITL